MSEKDVSSAVRDLLDAEHIPYWRMNSGKRIGSYTSKKTGKVKNWAIRLQKPGTADLLCAPHLKRVGTVTPQQSKLLALGQRMSNWLYNIKQHSNLLGSVRDQARSLQEEWDGIINSSLSSKSAGRVTTGSRPEDLCKQIAEKYFPLAFQNAPAMASGAAWAIKSEPITFTVTLNADLNETARITCRDALREMAKCYADGRVRDPVPLSPAASGHNPAWLWIECKAGKRGQTPEQQEFQRYVTDLGMFYLLARSSDDVLTWLREHK